MSMVTSDVYFGTTNLNGALGASTAAIHDFNTMPVMEKSISRIAGRNRSTVTSSAFTRKLATATFYAKGGLDELRAKVGLFKGLVQHKQLPLKVLSGIPTRTGSTYTFASTEEIVYSSATLESIDIRYGKGHYVIDVVFILLDPIGKGSTTQTIANLTAQTATPVDINFTGVSLQGTFEEQAPEVKVTVNSVTNGNTPTLSLSDGFNTATFSGALAAADVVIFNTEDLTVTVNGTMVDYSGVMPQLLLSDPELSISSTLTARNFDILVTNEPRYI